jgi:uncharacterized protein (TIGR00296 family)
MNRESGRAAVKIARKALEDWVRKGARLLPEKYPEEFNERRGVFVTIHTYPEKELRGCIGFPEPEFALIKGLVEAAVHAANDPRFPPLREKELGRVIVEVSVLTKPELIGGRRRGLPGKIKIGRDGLIIRLGLQSGLLLPQVATEYGWTPEEFLAHTCMKAGLPIDAWLDEKSEIYVFRSEIFSEKKPGVT